MSSAALDGPANGQADGRADDPAAGTAAGGIRVRSIVDFLTDGSLPELCEALGVMTGVEMVLIDPQGRRVRYVGPGSGSPWTLGDAVEPVTGLERAEIIVDDVAVGAIVAPGGGPGSHADEIVRLVAAIASEVCQRDTELSVRGREVSALYRLSSLLSHAADMDALLDAALESALGTLGLDAGSIVLFEGHALTEPTESGLVHKATRGLSNEWSTDPRPLSKDREFDRLSLGGEVVVVDDLSSDPRVNNDGRLIRERLVGFMCAGLIFKGRPLGVIRVYTHRRHAFSDADRRLIRSIAEQAAVAVAQAELLARESQGRKIKRQLRLAGDVQRRMLPQRRPEVPGFQVGATYIPSFEIGGDFYDCFEIDAVPGSERRGPQDSADLPKRLALVVGDVVGSGVPAALLMASVRASLRAFAKEYCEPEEILNRVNKALCRDTLESEFVTLWLGTIDPESLTLSYCSAGHEPPMIMRVPTHRAPTEADIDELAIGGMVLGIDPSQRYQRGSYDLHPGDVLLAYTDGLTEASGLDGDRFRRTRVVRAMIDTSSANPGATPDDTIESILASLRQFAGVNARTDDLTILATRVERD
ncbi:MAG: GAF domain-containing SpoIIE family protein phosphatase [Planctomycetota bacterium]